MEQSTFLERFTTASERARSFAQKQILEELPKLRIDLNQGIK
jgi:hypothetical protein